MHRPPFQITPLILSLSNQIQEILGELKAYSNQSVTSIKLRKQNKIKTIQYSLAIEGNSLSEEQITALLENRRVLGPKKDILEVKNALRLYENLENLNPLQESSFLRAHRLLTEGLVSYPGKYRNTAVGIIKNGVVNKMAPPAKQVPRLMGELFTFINKDKNTSFLLKSCIFHYELELIHPFEDGNGRMGRLWHQLLLMKHFFAFQFIPVESVIYKRQKDYYRALEASDRHGNSIAFIEFSLSAILEALRDYLDSLTVKKLTNVDRLSAALEYFKGRYFSRKEYMSFHKGLSTATASRDLAFGIKQKLITSVGQKATTKYQKAY